MGSNDCSLVLLFYSNFFYQCVMATFRLCPERISFHSNWLFLNAGVAQPNSCPSIVIISYINAPVFLTGLLFNNC